VLVRGDIHKLGHDTHPVPRAPYASLNQRSGSKLFANLAQAALAVLERHHRASRDHLQRFDPGQVSDDVLGNAVGKKFILCIGAKVHKRQHAN
jgi:hypothetical protein